ncbi:hypothetical protein V4R08_07280 [Nitrobacter sp. NHB1]|uniref:hypothetical protein n=1 Tax=Nitrobacter sp. NHB1 TaxID=3119830 RepID=UPI002FFFD29F
MKLNATQLKQTLNQMDAQVLPEDHPAVGQLIELFGDHTFFLDESGLKVLETTEPMETEAQTGSVVSLANWKDGKFSSLKPHDPVPTGDVIVLIQ